MIIGSRTRRTGRTGRIAVALGMSAAVVVGCGSDDDAADGVDDSVASAGTDADERSGELFTEGTAGEGSGDRGADTADETSQGQDETSQGQDETTQGQDETDETGGAPASAPADTGSDTADESEPGTSGGDTASDGTAASSTEPPAGDDPAGTVEVVGEVPPEEAAAARQVAIVDFAYDPDPVEVAAGVEIVWTNEDGADHTVTADADGDFDSGNVAQGEQFTLTLDEPGEYEYVCTIHPQMAGTIVVE